MARLSRTITPALPAEIAEHAGLSYSFWLPEGGRRPQAGVVILHGAGSCKENHYDFARAVIASGWAALAFDQRGHGASTGPMGGGALEDIARMTDLLREKTGLIDMPVALRGSSMGGYLAILAASGARARAIVAICPASAEGLRRGLLSGALRFDADVLELERFLDAHDLHEALAALEIPVLLLHAEGDEQVPVEHSRELAKQFNAPGSRLITVPGGHHRSVQHDSELRAVSLRFLTRTLSAGADAARP